MKTFKIFQIHLTDAEVNTINETGDHFAVPKQAARLRLQFGTDNPKAADDLVNDAFTKGYFEHVGNIRANDLEDVFEVGNIGPENLYASQGVPQSFSRTCQGAHKMYQEVYQEAPGGAKKATR